MVKIIGIGQDEKNIFLYYSYVKNSHTFFKIITSSDGFEFNGTTKYVIVTDGKKREETNFDWSNCRIAREKNMFFLVYRLKNKKTFVMSLANSSDLIRWNTLGTLTQITETAALIPDFKYKNRYVLYVGDKDIRIAMSGNLLKWQVNDRPLLTERPGMFDHGALQVGNVFQHDNHILVIYYVKRTTGDKTHYVVGAARFDKKDPNKLIWRSEQPVWEQSNQMEDTKMEPLGSVLHKNTLILYWLVNDHTVFAISCPIPGEHVSLKGKTFSTILKKTKENPIITPNPRHPWESRATFNSAALYADGKVHFVYRALGDTDLSVLGYATSSDGIHIDERSEEPIYVPTEPFECPGNRVLKTFADHFASGGGYGGIEDPRITRIDDMIYMTYVAFDGANPPRVALTSIPLNDFLDHRWDKWAKPKLISAPGMVNKNAVIFPEKINGKYVVFHRIYPNILIDIVDDLNFGNDTYLRGQYFIPPRKKFWDSKKVGAGAPPIKTKDGWLFIYQSVGYQDPGKYKIGAMLLDKNDPTNVLYRANQPIIEPNEDYENNGFKAGVVYPCGAVVVHGDLFVYYGGADTVVCAASDNLDNFLYNLKHNQEPKLQKINAPVLN